MTTYEVVFTNTGGYRDADTVEASSASHAQEIMADTFYCAEVLQVWLDGSIVWEA
jgi:hypothetical protein